MTLILNLTQHRATPTQAEAGVVDLPEEYGERLRELLTFEELPTTTGVDWRASEVADLATAGAMTYSPTVYRVLSGGAPSEVELVARALREYRVEVVFAFSRRESAEVTQADGSVRKTATFRHLGFVEAGR